MNIKTIEFADLERETARSGRSFLDYLAPEIGKAYVVTITRDNCPACKKQKPKLDRLAESAVEKHNGKTVFVRIHVKRPPDSQEESLRSKDLLRHYFYPTNLILIRTKDRGAIELYRNVSPGMSELGRNIEAAVKTAEMIEKET